MTAVEWPEGVNKKAYGQDSAYKENREEVTYKSGRTIFYRANSIERKTYTVNIKFDDSKKNSAGFTEFRLFINWFENVLAGGTNAFYFPDVTIKDGTTERLYYMKEVPTWQGQGIKEVSFALEEA